MEQKIMTNKYWIKRYYKYTNEIKHVVCNINKDMLYLSSYCDKLESSIKDLVDIISERLDDDIIRAKFNLSVEEFKKVILGGIIENHGSKR